MPKIYIRSLLCQSHHPALISLETTSITLLCKCRRRSCRSHAFVSTFWLLFTSFSIRFLLLWCQVLYLPKPISCFSNIILPSSNSLASIFQWFHAKESKNLLWFLLGISFFFFFLNVGFCLKSLSVLMMNIYLQG